MYHGLQHLRECLEMLDVAVETGDVQKPDLIEMALWFHDVVYDPQRGDNEQRSAEMAVEAIGDSEVGREIGRLVLLTCGHEPGNGLDDGWMLDIDLSVFGRPWERVREFEAQIRAEYAWVEDDIYRPKRIEILEDFLGRPSIYCTSYFWERFEEPARRNLMRLIQEIRTTT